MKFLIIDDNATDRELIIRRLRREFREAEFVEVSKQTDLDELLADGDFDVVLTDYQLNWSNGLVILSQIKGLYPDIPVVMFTGTGSEEIAVEGMRSGLSNYILKKQVEHLPFAIKESLEKIKLRKQYEDAIQRLKASEERYHRIFEQGLMGVFAFVPENEQTTTPTTLTCNPAFARIFGFASVEEAEQANVKTLFPDEQAYTAFIERAQQQKEQADSDTTYHELELRRRDGEPIYVLANVFGTVDKKGALVKINGNLFDITEQKRLEEQVRQVQKMESLGQLVSGIAHDFNNMLGGIMGHAERALSRVSPTHPLYDNLNSIRELATRGAHVTRQLLAFSRKQVLEPRDLSLNTAIAELLSFLSKVLEEHIEIEFQPVPDLKAIHADSTQMEQMLINLCVNARDAMPNGGKLLIETRNVTIDGGFSRKHPRVQKGDYVLLSVTDTGIGMDARTRERIFEPFFTTKEHGTGLGLSTVHGIVGQHNGFIDVSSRVGKGTTFKIYLPAIGVVPTSTEMQPARTVQGGNETVLVVEDDPDLRNLMSEILQEYGYTVISAANGEEGLQEFQKRDGQIALVVSDMMTPKMKGEELYECIHRLSLTAKFLFVSGYLTRHVKGNLPLKKDVNFLQKPFDLDELAAKVREILEQ